MGTSYSQQNKCLFKKDILTFSDFLKKYENIYSQDNLQQTRNKLIKKYFVYLISVIVLLWFSYLLYRI